MAAPSAADREALEQNVARGSDLLKQGKLDDAAKAFRSALLIDSDNIRVLALLGLTHFRAGNFAEARAAYEDLVERVPSDASHRLNLGLVHLKLGDGDSAIAALEASRALDPSQGRAVNYLGLAYARAGRYAEAYRAFLVAGQHELASEIEVNLTAAEREAIASSMRAKSPSVPPPVTAAAPPPAPPNRTKPPSEPAQLMQSMPAIIVDRGPPPLDEHEAAGVPQPPSNVPGERLTESVQFVLPRAQAVPVPAPGQSMLSEALAIATPAAGTAAAKVAAGSTAPIPLSQLATEALVRPDDGEEKFEISSNGALVIRVTERVLTRLDGVHVTGGDLAYEPAMRRSRGHQTDEPFNYGGPPLHAVTGTGYIVALPGERAFTAVSLDDDIFYLREDLVFAFESSLRWENGNIPGLRGRLPVVQFRGDGVVALRSGKPLVRLKLPAQGVVLVDASRLAGWIGRVIPRAVVPPADGPMGDVCIECTGEGVVLVDPIGEPRGSRAGRTSIAPPLGVVVAPIAPASEATKPGPPPPPQPAAHVQASDPAIELDVVKNADWLSDDTTGRDEI